NNSSEGSDRVCENARHVLGDAAEIVKLNTTPAGDMPSTEVVNGSGLTPLALGIRVTGVMVVPKEQADLNQLAEMVEVTQVVKESVSEFMHARHGPHAFSSVPPGPPLG